MTSQSASRTNAISFALVATLLVAGPLFRAGNRPLPEMLIELIALLMLALCLFTGGYRAQLSFAHKIVLSSMVVLPWIYLIPLSNDLWAALPGRELYAQVVTAMQADDLALQRLSVIPWATQSAALAIVVPVAVFLATVSQPRSNLQRLITLVLLMAAGQAVLSLLQVGDGPDSFFRLGNTRSTNSGSGTYVNRSHLAGFLEMSLPIALALLFATVGRGTGRSRWRQKMAFAGSARGHQAILYAALAVLVLLGLIFARSRTGIVLAGLGIVVITALLARRIGGENIYGWIGSIAAIAISSAAAIGLLPVLRRFVVNDPFSEGRWLLFSTSIDGIRAFFPFGSGPGTFPDVYPRFQSAESLGFINHAHNDYLEWIFETGIGALILIPTCLVLYAIQWRHVWLAGRWSVFRYSQVGAGVGIGLMLLHELVDFNLLIPANAIYLAFLAGVFFHLHTTEADATATTRRGNNRNSRTPRIQSTTPAPAADPIPNPFGN